MPIEPLPPDAALVERPPRVPTATLTTVLLKKGLRHVWIGGPLPQRPGQSRLFGRTFMPRFVPAREDRATPGSWGAPISTRAGIEAIRAGAVSGQRRDEAALRCMY
ncbi:MAG: hypothetical protein ABI277_00610 [Burkholderiaceae bacterium]